MLVDVETFLLDALVNTQTGNLLDAVEEDESCNCCPKVDAKDAEHLSAEESKATAIEGTAVDGEETCHQGSEDATDTVNGAGTNRVVNMKLGVNEFNAIDKNDTCKETYDERTKW